MNTAHSEAGKHILETGLAPLLKPRMMTRLGVAGVLMGLANLVPGVSGGTMILVMGLYDEMVSAVAEITRFQFTRRSIFFVSVVGGISLVCIASLAGPVRHLVTSYESAMYSLFIGLTIGGVPLLYRAIKPVTGSSLLMAAVGLALMVGIAMTKPDKPQREQVAATLESGEYVVPVNYKLDFLGGVLGASAMVLPGISGAYMLLIIGRYETVLASIALTKRFLVSFGGESDASGLYVLVPMALGTLVGLAVASNVLKWLLLHRKKATLGFLVGVLLGSIIGIWPFEAGSGGMVYAGGAGLALVGFLMTYLLSTLSPSSEI